MLTSTGTSSAALAVRSTCPPACGCNVEWGSSWCMIVALASGKTGSSNPAMTNVCSRISGNAKMLAHTEPASSGWRYPTREPAISWRSNQRLTIDGSVRAVPP